MNTRLENELQLSVFSFPLGWCGTVGSPRGLRWLTFGHDTADQVREAAVIALQELPPEGDWSPVLRKQLVKYASGDPVDFREVPLVERPQTTPFQQQVVARLREVPYGQTISYGELAALAGAPGAARAVGTVMSTNATPLVVPCHRVLAAAGRLGGYSARQGLAMKRRLLDLEAAHCGG